MQDYNQFVTAINKIFDYLTKLKAGWNNQDNYNYIDAIEEFKTAITNNAEVFKQPRRELDPEEIKELEERAAAEAAEEAAKAAEKAAQSTEPVSETPQPAEKQTAQPAQTAQPVEQQTAQPAQAAQPTEQSTQPVETLSEAQPNETIAETQPVAEQPIESLPQEETTTPVTNENIEQPTTETPAIAIPKINQPAATAPEVVESIKSVTEGQNTIESPMNEAVAATPIPNLVGTKDGAKS